MYVSLQIHLEDNFVIWCSDIHSATWITLEIRRQGIRFLKIMFGLSCGTVCFTKSLLAFKPELSLGLMFITLQIFVFSP